MAKTVDFLGKALITQKFRRYMAAIISGQVDIVDFLISVENLDSFSPSIAMSSIMSSSINRQERIDVRLELMGSAYILRDSASLRFALLDISYDSSSINN